MFRTDLGKLPTSPWRAPLGASCLLMSASAVFGGTAVSNAVSGTGPCAAMPAAPRHRGPVGVMGLAGVPASEQGAVRYGRQPANNNQTQIQKQYVTGGNALRVGASGPPRKREPA